MSAYTVSRLALDAGVSVHIVRDYLLRGLLRPVACTPGGYGLFDDAALQRLCFVRAAFEAGIGLDALARLCRALDAADGDEAAAQLAVLRQFVERRREALADLEVQLAELWPLTQYYPSPGGSDERVHLYVGRCDSRGAGGVHGLEEEGEDIRVLVWSLDEALAALDDGRIDNAASIIALQWLALNRDKVRERWA